MWFMKKNEIEMRGNGMKLKKSDDTNALLLPLFYVDVNNHPYHKVDGSAANFPGPLLLKWINVKPSRNKKWYQL